MRNGFKMLILSSLFVLPSMGLAQEIEIEFGNYGACPIYFIPGSDEYELCAQQKRQLEAGVDEKRVRFEEVRLIETLPKSGNHFNIQERYE